MTSSSSVGSGSELPSLSKHRLSILFLCQAFYWSTVIVGVSFSGLVGLQMASHQALATVPMATLTIGNILSTVPLSLFMQRYGRRAGFWIGAAAMVAGGLVCMYAIVEMHFWLFCLGNILLGIAQASAFYYRLAAADNVPLAQRGTALAWVLSGGVVAALVAPTIGLSSKDLFLPHQYLGAFGVVTLLGVLTAIILCFLPNDAVAATSTTNKTVSGAPSEAPDKGRSLKEIIRQPIFLIAILNTAVGNSVMILIMVATPLAILACGFGVDDSTSVIQWHVLGMFLPAFFSGKLIDRLGIRRIALLGCGLLIVSGIISIAGIRLSNFYSALFLLGVGWNFLYLSGSTLMTASHRPEERGKVQGFAELVVAIFGACAAFGSGVLLNLWGWPVINAVVVGLLVLTLVINLMVKLKTE